MAEHHITTDQRSILRLSDLAEITPSKDAVSANRIVGFNSRDSRARPFSLLRTSLIKKLKENNHRLVGITSASPAAGKSFLAMNLASSLARVSEEPVFLVDLDLRRASLSENLGTAPDVGVESFIEQTTDRLGDVGYSISGSNLGLFPCVRRDQDTAELLAGTGFSRMIEQFRNESEASIILFDLPPVFANDDAMIILEQLDSYIMVADAGKTTRKQVEEVVAMLQPTPCIGSILNRYKGGFGDSYGYGYGGADYSRYYEQT